MASIRQRGDTWQARVSRMGFPSESRTFSNKAEARRWATEVEAAMLRGRGAGHCSSGYASNTKFLTGSR